jgi:hypothetical protein
MPGSFLFDRHAWLFGLLATIAITEVVGLGPEDPLADAAVAEEIAAADAADAAAAEVDSAGSFFYSDKVLQQMNGGPGEFHSFPESVTAFGDAGSFSTITGGDGQAYEMLEIPGSYTSSGGNIYDGNFQFIKDSNGVINHRLFVPNP